MDSLRGFSMILVVISHVLLCMDLSGDKTAIGIICQLAQLPLFFFISGFFSYKSCNKWNKRNIFKSLFSRLKCQIVAPIVFFALWQIEHERPVFGWWGDGFGWFWFTVALFQMYLIYWILVVVFRKFKNGENIIIGVISLTAVGLLLYRIRYIEITCSVGMTLEWNYIIYYFQFFVFGLICSKFYDKFHFLLAKDWIRTVIVIGCIGSIIYLYAYNGSLIAYNSGLYRLVEMILSHYMIILTIYLAFYSIRRYCYGEARVAKIMRLIGRRTLDIYMLHMFFMPSLNWMYPFMTSGFNMIVFEVIVALGIASIDICLCLIVSKVLRVSKFLSVWLFGDKQIETSF